MTGKEILLIALQNKETPRLPVGVLDGHGWILAQEGKSFQDLFAMDVTENAQLMAAYYRKLESDFAYSNGHVFNIVHRILGGEIYADGIGETISIKKAAFSEINAYQNFDSAQVMEQAFATPEYQNVLAQAKTLTALLREEKLVCGLAYGSFTVAAMLVGAHLFMKALKQQPDDVVKLIDFATDLVIRSMEKFVETGAEAVFIADPVASGDLIGPAVYEAFALPALKKVCARFNSMDIPVFCHVCGKTENRLQPMIESGVAAFSVDSIDLDTALAVSRGHYTLMGNVSPFAVLMDKTPDEVRAICDALAVVAGRSGGYVMFPGCDLAPQTPLENVKAMVAAAYNAP